MTPDKTDLDCWRFHLGRMAGVLRDGGCSESDVRLVLAPYRLRLVESWLVPDGTIYKDGEEHWMSRDTLGRLARGEIPAGF